MRMLLHDAIRTKLRISCKQRNFDIRLPRGWIEKLRQMQLHSKETAPTRRRPRHRQAQKIDEEEEEGEDEDEEEEGLELEGPVEDLHGRCRDADRPQGQCDPDGHCATRQTATECRRSGRSPPLRRRAFSAWPSVPSNPPPPPRTDPPGARRRAPPPRRAADQAVRPAATPKFVPQPRSGAFPSECCEPDRSSEGRTDCLSSWARRNGGVRRAPDLIPCLRGNLKRTSSSSVTYCMLMRSRTSARDRRHQLPQRFFVGCASVAVLARWRAVSDRAAGLSPPACSFGLLACLPLCFCRRRPRAVLCAAASCGAPPPGASGFSLSPC